MSGGDVGAKAGKLVAMIGGDKADLELATPLLNTYCMSIQHMGEAGAGQHTKVANQIICAVNVIGICEGLIYGHKAGLDLSHMLDLIANGTAGSFILTHFGKRILRQDFEPGIFTDLFIKDLGIAVDEARRLKLSLPGLNLASSLYMAIAA